MQCIILVMCDTQLCDWFEGSYDLPVGPGSKPDGVTGHSVHSKLYHFYNWKHSR